MELKFTFSEDPELYERMRPKYPEKLISDIIEKTSLRKEKEILEIGPGTGQITAPFAEKGFRMTCIELGKGLATFLGNKFKGYPNVNVINSAFEDWASEGKTYDLIISAQAFHWIDRQIGYSKAAGLLTPGGFLALIWIFSEPTEYYRKELDIAYQKYMPNSKPPESIERHVQNRYQEIESVKIFAQIKVFQYPFRIEYGAEEYLDLLNTYSDHRALENEKKTQLFQEIKAIIDHHGGKLKREYVAVLYLMQN